MNMTSLQTFLAIIETGSLVRASHKLNVTQSTITARLKTLEDELGQVLLNRQKSGTTLTPAGNKLMRYAKIMNDLWQQAKFETNLPAGLESVCTFGCDRELWHGPGRRFFYTLNTQHPQVALSVRQGNAQDLSAWLSDGSVDVILTYEAIARGSQTVFDLPAEDLVLYSDRKNSPFIGDPFYIYVDHGGAFRQQHAETYHAAGIARINFDSSWWALQYILDNQGSAYLPRALAQDYETTSRIFEVQGAPVFTRKKCLVVNDAVATNWNWFPGILSRLQAEQAV